MRKAFTKMMMLMALLVPFALQAQTYQSVPYSEGFENPTGSPTLPTGWVNYATGSSGAGTFPSAYNYSSNARNGNYYYELESSTGVLEIGATPEFENVSGLMMDFYYCAVSTYSPTMVEIGVMEDTVFVPVDTMDITYSSSFNSNNYHPYRVYFVNYTGDGHRIAFRAKKNTSSQYTFFIDDLTISFLPGCPYMPSNVTSTVDSISATLSWSAPATSNGSFIYLNNDSTWYNTYDTSYTFSGLTPNTFYSGFVFNSCDGTDTSEAVPFSFQTSCAYVAIAPGSSYMEGFEGGLSACFRQEYVSGSHNWSATPTSSNPSSAHGGTMVAAYTHQSSGSQTMLILPTFDMTGLSSNAELGFWHTQVAWSGDQDELYVYYRTSDTAAWTLLESYTNNITSWTEEVLSLPNSASAEFYQIAFKGVDSYGYGVKLDDISVYAGSSCAAPIAFYSTGSASGEVSLEWRDTISYAWDLVYGPMGLIPDTVVTNILTSITDTNTTVMGLEDTITYDFYLRADCGSEQSRWIGPVTVRPNVFVMTANGNDTIHTCGGTITDDGGLIGNYDYDQTSYMVVYPEDSTQTVSLTGSASLYGTSYCTLTFYEGVGTTGRTLASYTSSESNIAVASTTGAITIKFESYGYSDYYSAPGFELIATCSNLSSCPDPYDLSVTNVAGSSATLNWGYSNVATPDFWSIEVIDTLSGNTLTFTAADSARSYQLTGLDQTTFYIVRLQSSCTSGDTSNFITTSFLTPCLAGGEIQIGEGTVGLTTHPINTYYNYSVCQMVFRAEELSQVRDSIFGIKLLANSVASGNYSIDIYMDTTSVDTLNGTLIAMSPSKLVYSASRSFQAGENEFRFDSVWLRPDMTSNILVTIDNNSGFYTSNSYWQGTGGLTGSTLYNYGDGTNYDPTSAISVNNTDNRPNVVFMTPCSDANCVAPNVTASTNANSITLNWVAGSSETEWSVEYKLRTDTTWTVVIASTSATTTTISGLMANTEYTVRVSSLCGDTTAATLQQVRTACGALTDANLPFIEDFEGFTASSSTDELEPCWHRGPSYTSYGYTDYYPYAYEYFGNASNTSIYFSAYDVDNTLILPEIGISADSLFMSFYTYYYSYDSPSLVVGVMTDPTVDSTFVPVTTINLGAAETWNLQEVDLWNYTGTGRYLAIRCSADYLYLDDLTVKRNSTCLRVDSIAVSNVTGSSADISFVDTNYAGSYTIFWSTTNDVATATDSLTVTSSPFSLTGLVGNTYYYAWIRTNCANENSFLANVGRFRTQCPFEVITATDYFTEDFENGFSACTWQQYVSGNHDWEAISTTSNPSAAHSGSNVASFTHMSNGSETMLIMPTFDMTALNLGAELSFWHTQAVWAGDQDELYVYYRTSDTAAWTLLQSYTNNIPDWTEEVITLPNSTNASYYEIAFKGVDSYGYGVKLDDISVYAAPTCLRPDSLNAVTTDVTATLSWVGTAASFDIEYRQLGDTTVYTATSTSNICTISGLSSLVNYEFRVRGVCSATEQSLWSVWMTFQTQLCANPTIVYSYDSTMSATTSDYAPMGYSYYNYAYVQTIVDSAMLAGLSGDITAMAFSPATTGGGDRYTNMDIYLANVSDTSLESGFIYPDSTHTFVQVTHGANLCYSTTDWQIFSLDTTFTWDGHSNILVSVNRRHGSYTSGSSFNVHNTSTAKTRYIYQDGSAYDPTSVTGGSTGNFVGDLQFITCGTACAAPVITSETHDYESATITWSGSGSSYQVAIKETAAVDWPTETTVAGNTYTFTGLLPQTDYTFRVRQDCSLDSNGLSNWTMGGFTTDSLPCFAPENLSVFDLTNAQGTFSWTARGNETQWDLHVWNTGGLDTVYRVTDNPVTVGGFVAGVTYNAAIRAICGSLEVEGEYGATITFTTMICPNVTGLTTSNVTYNSVTLNWTADPMAEGWMIEYGYTGFAQGTGTNVTTQENSYVVNGLEDETSYDFYVKAICGDNWNSENWTRVSATTNTAPSDQFTVTVSANDPAMGSVTGGGTYYAGETATLTATANAGYEFVGWSNGETANPYSFVVTANISLVANFQQTQGIEDVAGNIACTIYPNPTSAATTISVSGVNGMVRITVVDINGRTVATEAIECNADCQKTLDVDSLAQGTYFVRIAGENVNMVKKLVVR